MNKMVILLLISTLLVLSFQFQNEKIVRFVDYSVQENVHEVIPLIIEFNDTLLNDTLFEYLNKNMEPIMYSRKFLTGVCIDGKCRLLNIELFWNITGRYLGFELPGGEFLSKTEHVKFNSSEYDKLQNLLCNRNSALANYKLEDLVPVKDTTETDAVSTATIAAVLDYIVPGAVYTTYTLWHLVYGSTKPHIVKITSDKITSEIVLKLLNGHNVSDKVWALTHLPNEMEINTALRNKLMEIISGDDIFLTEQALNALKPNYMIKETQIDLLNIFNDSGFLQRRLIIRKLEESEILDDHVVKNLSAELGNLKGVLIKMVLEMFIIHEIKNKVVVDNVAALLKNENLYIANQALNYLETLGNPNDKTMKAIENFKKNDL